MSRDDEEQARKDNQLLVRAQYQALGLPQPKQDRRPREAKGIAHVLLKLSEMPALPSDELLEAAIEKAKKTLRTDIANQGGIVDTVDTYRRINGDVEVRAGFTVKRADA